jgi:hypothetical protein
VDSREHDRAATFDELQEELAESDLEGVQLARELADTYRDQHLEMLDETFGVGQDKTNGTADAVDGELTAGGDSGE